MNVADLLRDEIRRRGIRQNEAAQIMDVGQALLSKWLGPTLPRPSSESCAKIAAFVGVDPTTILRITGHLAPDAQTSPSIEDAPPANLHWEIVQRQLREIFERLEESKWDDLTRTVEGVVGLVRPEPEPPDSDEQDGDDKVEIIHRASTLRKVGTHLPARQTQPSVNYGRELLPV